MFRRSKAAQLDVKSKGKRKRSTNDPPETCGKYKLLETSIIERIQQITDCKSSLRMDERIPKDNPITDDYEISNHVLGLGINGKVVQCSDKITGEKYALKVNFIIENLILA